MYSTSHINQTIAHLRDQIIAHESQLHNLKEQLAQAEHSSRHIHDSIQAHNLDQTYSGGLIPDRQQETWDGLWNSRNNDDAGIRTRKEMEQNKGKLELEEYTRYGRQLILPEIGLQGRF